MKLIEHLRGTLLKALPTGAIVDVSGVGYGIEMPLSALSMLPKVGAEVSVWTYTYVREDQMKLFGFMSYADRLCFEILISLNGVGPKVALAILSTMSLSLIENAITREKPELFEIAPGVGKRLGEKILVELKPKLKKLLAAADGCPETANRIGARADYRSLNESDNYLIEDLRSALENFGYKDKQIAKVMTMIDPNFEGSFTELMRTALKGITGNETVS